MTLPDEPEVVESREQAEALMQRMCRAHGRLRSRSATMDLELAAVRARYKDLLTLSNKLKEGEEALHKWAETEDFASEDAEKRSLELRHGTIGFRKGNRKLRAMAKTTMVLVLEAMKRRGRQFLPWIRRTEEIDLAQMLRDSKGTKRKLKEEDLERVGLEIHRDDNFFIEVKSESIPEAASGGNTTEPS
jgi:hypothetical protein